MTGKHIEKLQSVWGKWCDLLTSPTLIPLQLDFASHPVKGLNQFPHPLNLTGLVICFDPWNSERACCVTSKPRSQETLGSVVKSPLASTRDMGLIPGSGGYPREGNGNPLPYSCMKEPMTEEPDGLQSMGSQRVRRDLATERTHTHSRHSACFVLLESSPAFMRTSLG